MPSLSFFADEHDAPTLINWLNRDHEIAFVVPDGPPDPLEAYVERVRALLGTATEAATLYPRFLLADAGRRQRWRAVRTVDRMGDGKHSLWHVPSGPLPLCAEHGPVNGVRSGDHAPTLDRAPTPDPWAGWIEHRYSADPAMPYFGPGHPAEVYLELWTRHRPYSKAERAALPVLFSYWTGIQDLLVVSTFGWIGDDTGPAPDSAWRWWRRLESWVADHAVPVGNSWDAEDTDEAGRWNCWAFPSAREKLASGMPYETRGWDLHGRVPPAESLPRTAEG